MTIKKDGDIYLVESSSTKGKFYRVDPEKPWCDCPSFKFHGMGKKGVCKHVKAVLEHISKHQQKSLAKAQSVYDDVKKFVADAGEADVIEAIDKFGEKTINDMIKNGELLEKRGKISLLK